MAESSEEMGFFRIDPKDHVAHEIFVVLETPDITDVRTFFAIDEADALEQMQNYVKAEDIELCHVFIPDNRWLRDWKIRKHLK